MTDRNKRGFTLLELAIVITIIATMTGMGIMAGVNALENARISQTNNKIAQIERAIWAYRVSNDRLPCPASLTLPLTSANFGVEGPNSANCINATAGAATGNFTSTDGFVVEGQVPTKTLGVPDDFAFDGWGNRLRYSVNLQLVETNGFSSTPADDTCAGSKITDGTSPTNFRTQSAAYALVSHGPNGHGAYTRSGAVKNAGSTNTGELSNCSCNSTAAATTYTATYVQRAEFRNPASSTDQFDDIVDYQMIWQMQRPVQNVVTTSTDTTNILGVVSLPNATPSAISSILLKQESGVFSFLPIANVSPMFGGTGWSQRAWTRDKSYVAYVHNSTIQLYKRVGDRLTRVSSFVSPTPGIPGYFQVQWSWSGKYLATASVGAGADGLYIFKRCGSKITQLNTTATHPIGTWQWTRDDQYLVNDWFSWFGVVKRTGDTFATAPTSELYPSGRPGGTQAPPIVSPSGDYAIHIEGNTIFPYVRNASGQYIPSSVPSVTVKAALGSWSPDETYFIMSHPWSDGTPDYLKAIKRNGSGVTATFTKLPASALVTQPDCGGSAWDIGWSADSQYFAVSGYGYGCNGIQTYRNNRDDTFTWLGTVAPPPGYGVYYGHTSEFGTFGKY